MSYGAKCVGCQLVETKNRDKSRVNASFSQKNTTKNIIFRNVIWTPYCSSTDTNLKEDLKKTLTF